MRKDTIADISLIIPVFNSTKDQLDSLLSPIRDKNLDLIIEICFVDDASTQPLSIPDWVKEQFDVAITVNSKNLGPLRSRIKGANLCTGAYVHFVDQDDQLTAEVVDAYAEALRSNPSILMFRARTQNGDRFNERGAPYPDAAEMSLTEHIINLLNYKYLFSMWNKLFDRHSVQKAATYLDDVGDLRFSEDLLFQYYIFCCATTLEFNPTVGYTYIQQESSLSSAGGAEKLEQALNGFRLVNDHIIKTTPKEAAWYDDVLKTLRTREVTAISNSFKHHLGAISAQDILAMRDNLTGYARIYAPWVAERLRLSARLEKRPQ